MNYIFKAISEQTRRDILDMLKERDMNAGEIADEFNMTKPSISHHLDILKRADLISSRKDGQYVIYSLNTSVLEDLFQWVYKLKTKIDEKSIAKRGSILGADTAAGDLSD